MKRRYYKHQVVALGMETQQIKLNVSRLKEQGWSLLSTYVDPTGNPALRTEFKEGPIVMGIFESWEKK